jgi:hypothetical protein
MTGIQGTIGNRAELNDAVRKLPAVPRLSPNNDAVKRLRDRLVKDALHLSVPCIPKPREISPKTIRTVKI